MDLTEEYALKAIWTRVFEHWNREDARDDETAKELLRDCKAIYKATGKMAVDVLEIDELVELLRQLRPERVYRNGDVS